jgi:hypothetical protein
MSGGECYTRYEDGSRIVVITSDGQERWGTVLYSRVKYGADAIVQYTVQLDWEPTIEYVDMDKVLCLVSELENNN